RFRHWIEGDKSTNQRASSNLQKENLWPKLEQFVHDEVYYNGQRIGILGYREMLERDFHEIPHLYFNIQLLISDPPYIASRLGFDCTPKERFLGLQVNGKRVSFTEVLQYDLHPARLERATYSSVVLN